MTDRQRANALLNYGIALGADGMTYQQAAEYTMRDIAAIREDECKAHRLADTGNTIDHSPDAGNMVAMELVEKIREELNPMCYLLDEKQAAALIEQYGRRVPRKMLEEIERKACRNGDIGGCSCLSLNKIAAKHHVKIEEDGK